MLLVSSLAGYLFEASVLACFTVGFLAIDRIEKQIDKNIEEASARKPIGTRKRKALDWPRRMLKEATLFWALSTTFIGVGLIAESIFPGSQLPNLSTTYYLGGGLCFVLAAIQTGNVVAFMNDRKFKPTLKTSEIIAAILIVTLLVADCSIGILVFLLLPHFSTLSLLSMSFVVSLLPSLVGTSLVVHQVLTWKKGTGFLYWLGILLFAAPYIVLVFFGILIRLGVPT